jgi:hypothetical protein
LPSRALRFGDLVDTIGHSVFPNCAVLAEVALSKVRHIVNRAFLNTLFNTFLIGQLDSAVATAAIARKLQRCSFAIFSGTVHYVNDIDGQLLLKADGSVVLASVHEVVCESLFQEVFSGLRLVSIYSSAFKDCHSLVAFSLADSVSTIDDSAFANCSALTALAFNHRKECVDAQTLFF